MVVSPEGLQYQPVSPSGQWPVTYQHVQPLVQAHFNMPVPTFAVPSPPQTSPGLAARKSIFVSVGKAPVAGKYTVSAPSSPLAVPLPGRSPKPASTPVQMTSAALPADTPVQITSAAPSAGTPVQLTFAATPADTPVQITSAAPPASTLVQVTSAAPPASTSAQMISAAPMVSSPAPLELSTLRKIVVPESLVTQFLDVASENSARNIETLGTLAGKLANDRYMHIIFANAKLSAVSFLEVIPSFLSQCWPFLMLKEKICSGKMFQVT